MKKKVGIVCGGYSGEAAVSMKSAEMLLEHIDRDRYEPFQIILERSGAYVLSGKDKAAVDFNDFSFDHRGKQTRVEVCLIIVHGTPGEDGKLQGYFDMIGMPYTTGGVLNMALTFNKRYTTTLLTNRGFRTARGILLDTPDQLDTKTVIEKLDLPVFVKPNEGGSSLGISMVKEERELRAAVEKAYREKSTVLIEEYLEGREFTCAVICKKEKFKALAVTEITTEREFFDYQAKYELDRTKEITPADLPKNLYKDCQETSEAVARALECKGVVRVDYKLVGNQFCVIEINTVPGMSAASLVPQQAVAAGINMTELVDLMVQSAEG